MMQLRPSLQQEVTTVLGYPKIRCTLVKESRMVSMFGEDVFDGLVDQRL
jgi:hypothetical protein